MHRTLVTAVAALTAALFAATASANGAYERHETADVAACARACEDDSICQAWAFSQGACDLAAAAPFDAKDGAATGFSSRAPDFVRGRPVIATVESVNEIAPIQFEAEAREDASEAVLDADYALLGGPETGALRQRLPN